MMAQNLATAEAGGYPEETGDIWWLTRWSSWLATIGAVLLAFIGTLAVTFNLVTLSISNAVAGGCQIMAAAVILAIEGSSVVSFLTFAKPVGAFFEGKPLTVKTAVYAVLTVLPMMIGSSAVSVMFGFIISASITAIYGMILIGKKGSLDSMKAAAAQQPKI